MARWLLLACTIIGLAAMHSLGHGSSHTGAGHVSAAAHGERLSALPEVSAVMSTVVTTSTALLTAAPAAVTNSVCSGECHHAGGPERHRDDTPGFSVCLAVLAAFAIAVLLAWLRLRLIVPARTRTSAPVLWVASRTPRRTGAGLRVAGLSVTRR